MLLSVRRVQHEFEIAGMQSFSRFHKNEVNTVGAIKVRGHYSSSSCLTGSHNNNVTCCKA